MKFLVKVLHIQSRKKNHNRNLYPADLLGLFKVSSLWLLFILLCWNLEPDQQPPPEHRQNSSTELWLKWKEPDYPNGVIKEYRLFRNGTLIFTGNSSSEYRKTSELIL